MTDDLRHDLGHDLSAELDWRADAEHRMAAALVELERHPGHVLLSTTTPTGHTAQRWAQAQEALAGLWRDFVTYKGVVAAARDEVDPAALHRLLREASIEVSRSVVERTLTGAVERVETLTLEQLSARMEAAYRVVDEVVHECAARHRAALAGLAPLAEQLRTARAVAADLDAEVAELAAVAAKVEDLDRAAAVDPLSPSGQPSAEVLDALAAEIAAVSGRLAEVAAVRDGWHTALADLDAAFDEIRDLGEQERRARERAATRIAGPPLPLPPDRLPALRRRLAALTGPIDWFARAAGLDAVRRAVDEAQHELRAAHELAAGLLARRDELRGRFESYRAKAARLGHAEHPDLLRLGDDVRSLLWTGPCDLAAATRALVDYQRVLHRVDSGEQGRPA